MLKSPVEQDGPEKGIAATEEAAVDCVNSGSLLTVPMNVCERLCRRSFSVTAHVFFRVAIVTILFMERTIFRIFEDLTWNSTPRSSGTCHCSVIVNRLGRNRPEAGI